MKRRTTKGETQPGNRGGDGASVGTAVVVDAANIMVGTEAEYAHIGGLCGRQGNDWSLVRQSTFRAKDRTYDQIEVRLADGGQRTFYFDVTDLMTAR
ncbi:MAG TPA: hypothetical protein PLU30_27360 [Verrucomicrobiae bacterium]|nr:hypothetical protein [Verrucomicrobiae bacterium]